MNIKLSLKNIVIGISAAIILLIIILMAAISAASRKPVAAFYGLSQRNQQQITDVLQTTHQRKNKRSLPFEVVTLDDSISLERALKKAKKADLVFVRSGLNLEYASNLSKKRNTGLPETLLSEMTTSIKQVTPSANGKITAVPLLIDHEEVCVNLEKFHSSSVRNINVISDLEKLARISKSSTPYPVVFAGADDDGLINFFGALTEALTDRETLESAEAEIAAQIKSGKVSQNDFYDLLKTMTSEKGKFYTTASTLKDWSLKGILPKNIYTVSANDIQAFMATDLATVAFLNLSEHREMERSVVTKYSSVYYPGTSVNVPRSFTAPVIFAVPLSKDKVAANSIRQLATTSQAALSAKTGLAPVDAHCAVPDVQADDVRYWVAASNAPLPALSDALFVSKQQKNAFAEALRAILR